MIFRILVTIFLPLIALLDWTFSNYPLRDFLSVNWNHYKEFMGWQ
jgi:hypothetical protein